MLSYYMFEILKFLSWFPQIFLKIRLRCTNKKRSECDIMLLLHYLYVCSFSHWKLFQYMERVPAWKYQFTKHIKTIQKKFYLFKCFSLWPWTTGLQNYKGCTFFFSFCHFLLTKGIKSGYKWLYVRWDFQGVNQWWIFVSPTLAVEMWKSLQ